MSDEPAAGASEPEVVVHVTAAPGVPRPKPSTARTRSESDWPTTLSTVSPLNRNVSRAAMSAAGAPTGKNGVVANGRYSTALLLIDARPSESEKVKPVLIPATSPHQLFGARTES